ncbi:MAG: AAA family ATPase, partial [Christensenellaceae bacterium]|nr:AAA family ATPase [Christensenellaceae bacterium]
MLKRKIYGRLRDWKAARDRDCLVLKGARQVGKTFIVDRFGRENYKSFIHIDF